jgi:organic hydroperoxide reductase OsmC/OhrA
MHEFITTLERSGGERLIARAEGRPDLTVSSPTAFGGEAGLWTPEDLVVSAVETCLALTAQYFVQKNRIGLKQWTSRTRATMEKGPGGLHFTAMEVAITATVAADEDVAKLTEAVHLAEKFCPVSNALSLPIAIRLDATVA